MGRLFRVNAKWNKLKLKWINDASEYRFGEEIKSSDEFRHWKASQHPRMSVKCERIWWCDDAELPNIIISR